MRFTDRWERWRLTQQGVQKLVAAGLRQGGGLCIVLSTIRAGKSMITVRIGVVGPAVAAVDIFCDGLDYGLRGAVIELGQMQQGRGGRGGPRWEGRGQAHPSAARRRADCR